MIDRTLAPAFGQVEDIELLKAKPIVLGNGLKVFSIKGGEQDLVRIEFIFENIAYNASKPLQSYATNTMLNDGTSELSSSDIADKIDYYGAFLQTDFSNDQSSVTLYSLNKHLSATLPIVKAVISDSIFPQVELDTFIRNQKQKLSVNLEKNDFLSRKIFNSVLFGSTLYGYDTRAEDYDKLTRDQLQSYFNLAYRPENCTVIISGKVTDLALSLIDELFGKSWNSGKDVRGYFGSRLMANIREDKGYTYGIGSALVSMKNAGYFFIASEVGADVCTPALEEIHKEIEILKTREVSAPELDLVRNYMLGSMLGGLENAMSHADKFKNIYFSGLGYDYYQNYIKTVRTISPQDLQALANKYLDWDSLEKVVVGKKD